ncbi:hypothetical protein [Spongiactinospora rosea]|nr:hypothetical protein [Spongiactinospora rosea]
MDELTPTERAHLHALDVTFPGWLIDVRNGTWWAAKRTVPTLEQRAAGVVDRFARPGPVELCAALGQQIAILARMGAA